MAILAALASSTISRLRKTWDGLPSKYTGLLDKLRKSTEHTRNYAEYRTQLREATPPALPFLGLFLTDITFCYEGNAAYRSSPADPNLRLINFDRYSVRWFEVAPSHRSQCCVENDSHRERYAALSAIVQSPRGSGSAGLPQPKSAKHTGKLYIELAR